MTKTTILVDLERCTGCWTCAMACKVAHKLEDDKYWLYVKTLGGGGIDEPGGQYPDLHISWQPIYTDKCILCADRTKDDGSPYCVYNCPSIALTYGDLDDPESAVSLKFKSLSERGYRTLQFPEWEGVKDGILYLSKGE